jgi:hypothetical protein
MVRGGDKIGIMIDLMLIKMSLACANNQNQKIYAFSLTLEKLLIHNSHLNLVSVLPSLLILLLENKDRA